MTRRFGTKRSGCTGRSLYCRLRPALLCFLLLLLLGVPAPGLDIGPKVAISTSRLDPPVFMKGDTGVVTVDVTNAGSESVFINSARLSGVEVSVIERPDQTSGSILPGGTVSYTYKVRAEGSDGIYYLRFILDFREGGSSFHNIPVAVESSTLTLSILEIPDPVTQGVKGDYTVMIGNPRPNAVNAVSIVPEGDGFLATPSGVFLGTLEPDASSVVTFNVTPLRQTFIRFRANFKNGINPHTATMTLPIEPVENRIRAEPVLTNIRVRSEQGAIHVSGDVTNVGLEIARSVTITTQGEVTPVDPYRVYVVGNLAPDGLAPFEVTFRSRAPVEEVPLLITYKDPQGSIITLTSTVEISRQALSDQSSEPSRFFNLLVWMFVVVIAAVFIYVWRRG